MNKIFSVSQINHYIANLIAKDFTLANIFVRGEISNFKHHYSGHMYFTLKDDKSLMKAVMFKMETRNLNFRPEDGMKVVIKGRISVYERDGVYQIYVNNMELDGIGELHAAFENLKNKLAKEGLFDEKYKKKLPYLPRKIGVLTSKTGSVVRDILHIINRRFPNVEIIILPVAVQGIGAAKQIAQEIEFINDNNYTDVIILARGGGSLEELWQFNEEILARAIFNSKIPVVSAVGHETDFTIADFVADKRAPTPSAAAEIVVPDQKLLDTKIRQLSSSLKGSFLKILSIKRLQLEKLQQSRVIKYPDELIRNERIRLDNLNSNLINLIKMELYNNKMKYTNLISKFEALSPLKTIKKGYSIIEKQPDGEKIKTIKDINVGDNIVSQIIDGKIYSKIFAVKVEKLIDDE